MNVLSCVTSSRQTGAAGPQASCPALAVDRVAAATAVSPQRTALSLGNDSLTYAGLDVMANGIARTLRARGVAPGSVVALYLDRSFALIAAMLGVWKAGCAYLPIEITSPLSRTEHILNDSGAAIVITSSAHQGELCTFQFPLLIADAVTPCETMPAAALTGDDLAYVIYTSGSTGTPKGVMVTHGNLASLLHNTEAWFGFSTRDVWTMFHSAAFDFSVWEIWGALAYSGRLVIVPFSTSRSPEDFHRLLVHEGVTVLNQTPTAFCMFIQAEERVPRRALPVRLVILGGEALHLPSLLPLYDRHGDDTPQIVNMYGITETTVHVTARFLSRRDVVQATESLIGTPIPGLRLYLLDEHLRPVPNGATGEICVSGAGVSLGYLNQPGRTAKRFVEDPFTGGRMYRSGDLGRMRADGELVYLGRADNQVKVNGFRIELGEVESVLAGCPGIAHVCVTAVHDPHAGTRLAAYFVTNRIGAGQRTLCAYADRHLASYMRPAFWTQLPSMPMNANGKADRSALPSPAVSRALEGGMSELESQVARAWRRVLLSDSVGADTNFFDAGGNSLLLVSLRSQLQRELNVQIPVTWMFEAATVRSFAKRLEAASSEEVPTEPGALLYAAAQNRRSAFAAFQTQRSGR